MSLSFCQHFGVSDAIIPSNKSAKTGNKIDLVKFVLIQLRHTWVASPEIVKIDMVYNKKCDCQHILKLSFISLLTSYSQKSLLQNSAPLQSKPRVPPFSSAKDHTMQREIQLRKPMQTNLCQQNKTQHARHEQQTD